MFSCISPSNMYPLIIWNHQKDRQSQKVLMKNWCVLSHLVLHHALGAYVVVTLFSGYCETPGLLTIGVISVVFGAPPSFDFPTNFFVNVYFQLFTIVATPVVVFLTAVHQVHDMTALTQRLRLNIEYSRIRAYLIRIQDNLRALLPCSMKAYLVLFHFAAT